MNETAIVQIDCRQACADAKLLRELEAARRVVNLVRPREATLGNGALGGAERVRVLMAAFDEYVEACGGPEAAEKIMESVERERMR